MEDSAPVLWQDFSFIKKFHRKNLNTTKLIQYIYNNFSLRQTVHKSCQSNYDEMIAHFLFVGFSAAVFQLAAACLNASRWFKLGWEALTLASSVFMNWLYGETRLPPPPAAAAFFGADFFSALAALGMLMLLDMNGLVANVLN